MIASRSNYLDRLIRRRENQSIKVITGMRRCGKSFLLFRLYRDYLLSTGVREDQIIELSFDDYRHQQYKDQDALIAYIESRLAGKRDVHYLFLDEVQLLPGFEAIIIGLNRSEQLDIYVTGSNSKFLSTDIITEFRGRGDEIRLRPLSYAEFVEVYDKADSWQRYYTFGGLPGLLIREDNEQKISYLESLLHQTYISDLFERHAVRNTAEFRRIIDYLFAAIGSLTNPRRIANTLRSEQASSIVGETVSRYLTFLEEAFLFESAQRYDVKGRRYLASGVKYYASDLGLRNVALQFRQQEVNHIMENIIYNELRARQFMVDVGVIETQESKGKKRIYKQLEVDFVANKGAQRYYIQSAYQIPDATKRRQEERPLGLVDDAFKKIIVVADDIYPQRNEQGYLTIGIRQFLLDEQSLDI